MVDPEGLADYILAIPDIEGMTVTGGEPFQQAAAIGRLCRMVRRGGLSVMVFTGWQYGDICRSPHRAVSDLLGQIDLLVDGPFVKRLADKDLLWRGSSNQQIRFLTNRYAPGILQRNRQPRVEGHLTSGATLHITGFLEESDMAVLAGRLAAETGILLETTDASENEDTEQGV
jgi:anaerobic ribonucleoside-triphosphate reductase activating protein